MTATSSLSSVDRLRRLAKLVPILGRLGWRLMRDPRVPRRHRAVLLAAVGYVVSPVDLIPDPLPIIGEVDDLLVITAGVAWILRVAPRDVVDGHLAELGITRPDLEGALVTVLPVPLRLAYHNRHEFLPPLEQGARRGVEALIAASERLRLTRS